MPVEPATATAIALLSQPIKDLYTHGKDKFGEALAKWSNTRSIRTLATKVRSFERVKTIWQRDKEVPLTSFYYPSKVVFSDQITKKISSLRDLPISGNLVLEGTVGQGKSVFLRYLCTQELRSQSSGRIPVFVELRKLDSKTTIKDVVYNSLEYLGFQVTDELFAFYADSGKLVLLLDAFDELDEACVNPVINTLEAWSHLFPKLQIIVTSRPNGEIQKSSHFTVFKLAPLSADDHKPFLMKVGTNGVQLDNLMVAIANSPSDIKEFLTTPLLLTLLVLVYKAESAIPTELPEFFNVLFVTVFSKHDGTKPGYKRPHKTGLNERKLELLFESFCFAIMRRGYGVSLDTEQLDSCLDEGKNYLGENCDLTAFRHDLVKVACLILEDGFRYVFAHKSLLDYFSAAFIKHRTEKQSEKIYNAIRFAKNGNAWRPVIHYLSLIDKYKYIRFYALPETERALTIFEISSVDVNAFDADRCLDLLLKDFMVGMQKNIENSGWQLSFIKGLFTPTTLVENFLFSRVIPHFFNLTVGDDLIEKYKVSSLDMNDAFGDGQLRVDLPWAAIRTEGLLEIMRPSVVSGLKQLIATKNEYQQYLFKEDALADSLSILELSRAD